MVNEFDESNVVNSAINSVYQAMYAKTDKGFKNGETELKVLVGDYDATKLSNQITSYFDSLYFKNKMKKYFIFIEIKESELLINFKWGHHALIANNILKA